MLDQQLGIHDEAFPEDMGIHDPIHVLPTPERRVQRDAGIEILVDGDIAHDRKRRFLHPWRLDNVLAEHLVHSIDHIPISHMRAA